MKKQTVVAVVLTCLGTGLLVSTLAFRKPSAGQFEDLRHNSIPSDVQYLLAEIDVEGPIFYWFRNHVRPLKIFIIQSQRDSLRSWKDLHPELSWELYQDQRDSQLVDNFRELIPEALTQALRAQEDVLVGQTILSGVVCRFEVYDDPGILILSLFPEDIDND